MPPRVIDYALIVREPTMRRMLLIDQQRLPVAPDTPYHFWQNCAPVNQAIHTNYGLHVTTLRPLLNTYQPHGESGTISNVYLMRYVSGDLPPQADWDSLDTLAQFAGDPPFTPAQLRELIAITGGPPWSQFDWYDRLRAAINPICSGEPAQLRAWERSSIWRIPTATGDRYLKSVPALFAYEHPLTRWLHAQFPAVIPAAQPVELANSALFDDYGAQLLTDHANLTDWAHALRTYADIQIACLDQLAALADLGVPNRDLLWIGNHLAPFLADDAHFTRGHSALSAAEKTTLRQAMPRLRAALERLQTGPIPATLEHGDLWAGQIFRHDDRPIITDWSDATITHPFFSLPFLLEGVAEHFPDMPEAHQHLSDAYLTAWQDFGDADTLHARQTDATLLYGLHNAMRYHYDILPGMTQQWEMENMVNFSLRLTLQALG